MRSLDDLLDIAAKARAGAYAPYSKFAVGAALETADGTVFSAGNVENASYGLSICAERSAVVRAVAEGYREFRAIAVAGPDGALTSPCGACRQFIAEFGPQIPVIFSAPGAPVRTTIAALLPHSFGPKSISG